MKKLRDYQEAATRATFEYFETHNGNPLIVAPVGAGKSLLIAEFIRRATDIYPGTRFVVLAHVSELLTQNAQELAGQAPHLSFSFYSDKLKQKKLTGDVIFGGIQSIYKKAYDIPHKIDLVLVDECHLISPDNATMYRKFLDDLRVCNPHLKVIGYTGTPFRPGYGWLHMGDKALFSDIAFTIPILQLIEEGHLCPVVTPSMKTRMDVTGVKLSGGDFVQRQLEKAVDTDRITRACVDEIMQFGVERKKWMIFAAGRTHCLHVRDEIRSRGISCEMVDGKTPKAEREAILHRYKHGDLRCLVNIMCLTTGYNNPAIDLLAFMRPTRSPVLYVQCVGRALRTHPGKTDALVLDFGGVIEALGPLDKISIAPPTPRGPSEGSTEAPIKECPKCHAFCFTSARYCVGCGEPFPEPKLNIVQQASAAAILSTQVEPDWHEVGQVFYTRHDKPGKPPSLRVEYVCGMSRFSEWICLEHDGKARQKAVAWWNRRGLTAGVPPNRIDLAIERANDNELRVPARIAVKQNGKFKEIVSAEF